MAARTESPIEEQMMSLQVAHASCNRAKGAKA